MVFGEMTVKLESVCERLDRVVAESIETYQSLLEKRSLLNKTLDDGYLNLSKARSIMGCANVSMLQVPAEMDARVNVQVAPSQIEAQCDDVVDEELSVKFESLNFNLGYVQPPAPVETVGAKETTDAVDEDFDVVDKSELGDVEEEEEDKSKKTPPPPVDPTKLPTWFGVLTPLSLKQSHKAFSSSLSLITAISELQTRLLSLEQLYKQLLKEKVTASDIHSSDSQAQEIKAN